MNVTISKRDLYHLVVRASAIAEKKGTMPALSMALLVASDGRLTCSATDLYLARVDHAPAETKTQGSIAVSAHDLVDRVKNMPDGPVTLTTKENALLVKSEVAARRYTMRGMPGDDFPPIPRPNEDAPTITLPAGVLSSLIAHTAFSISLDETRPHLNSGLIELEPGLIRMVSTDGHRLSKVERKVDGGADASFLVPLKAINELRKLDEEVYAGGEGATITLIQSGPLFVRTECSTFSVKLVDATFPPYQQVIPKSVVRAVRVSRVALSDAIRAVAVSAAEKTGGVKLAFDKGTLRITSESPERGEGFDEISYALTSGKDGALVGLNARYPLDVLGAVHCDEIEIGLGGELDPVLMRPVGEGVADYLAVIMPMRI